MTTATARFQAMPLKHRLAAVALALSLIGTGIASLAVMSDTLIHTNQISALSVDLQGSTDGTTFTQSTSLSWVIESDGTDHAYMKALLVKNASNVNLGINFTASVSAGGSNIPSTLPFYLYRSPTQADCNLSFPAPVIAGQLTMAPSTLAGGGTPANEFVRKTTAPQNIPAAPAPYFTMAPGAEQWICMWLQVPAGAPNPLTGTITQTLNVIGTSS